jgi:hypothetical protein
MFPAIVPTSRVSGGFSPIVVACRGHTGEITISLGTASFWPAQAMAEALDNAFGLLLRTDGYEWVRHKGRAPRASS